MRITSFLVLFCVLSVVGALFCGCETEPASSPVNISPSSGTIRYGQSIQLAATGGYDYQWSLQDYSWGTLSVNTGPSTIYTSTYQGGATGQVQVITVNSTIVGTRTGTGTTNGTTYAGSDTATASAYITHL